MYGPPPDPREVPIPTGLLADPTGHALTLFVAVCVLALSWRFLRGNKRQLGLTIGAVLALTSPWLAHLSDAWFGAFPTIDKAGSLLFYENGVHQRLFLSPSMAASDPAIRLIGVHAGHLWAVAAWDVLLPTPGAFGAVWLTQMVLGWWCARLLIGEVLDERRPQTPWIAWIVAFPFGMGLHLFRDLNWGTVEKGGVFWLPLFGWLVLRALRGGKAWPVPLTLLGMALYNLYFALLASLVLGCVWSVLTYEQMRRNQDKRIWQQATRLTATSALAVLPIAILQHWIQSDGPALATPEQFLWERAALDGFSLVPFRWNRLEVWRACNPVVVLLAAVGITTPCRWFRWAGVVALGFWILSIGPVLLPGTTEAVPLLKNPVYLAANTIIPGFWRMAKPEMLFLLPWLFLLIAAGHGLSRGTLRYPRLPVVVATAMLLFWLGAVRTHPAFPGLSAPVETTLDPRWAERVFAPTTTDRP